MTCKLQLTTLLVVGEGQDDKAFLEHLKSLFCPRRCGKKVTIERGNGGSPWNIIEHAIRKNMNKSFDQKIILIDEDVPPNDSSIKKAKKNKFSIIIWRPQCLEGALLETLGEKVTEGMKSCRLKKLLHPRLNGCHTDKAAYAELFTQEVVEGTTNESIQEVLGKIRGGGK